MKEEGQNNKVGLKNWKARSKDWLERDNKVAKYYQLFQKYHNNNIVNWQVSTPTQKFHN